MFANVIYLTALVQLQLRGFVSSENIEKTVGLVLQHKGLLMLLMENGLLTTQNGLYFSTC